MRDCALLVWACASAASVWLAPAAGHADIASEPAWVAQGSVAGDGLGYAVTTGDFNCDGYDDLAAGAPVRLHTYDYDSGFVRVYYGAPDPSAPTQTTVLDWDGVGGAFGHEIAGLGDVDGDGCDDLLVAVPLFCGDNWLEGAAVLYPGGPGGVSDPPAWVWTSGQDGAGLYWVAPAGDINADGLADGLVAALWWDDTAEDQGVVWLFTGGAGGWLGESPAWTLVGSAPNRWPGIAEGVGDINGDGFDDVIVTRWPNMGGAVSLLFSGSASGLAEAADWTWAPGSDGAVWSAGPMDWNWDGFSDLALASCGSGDVETEEGQVFGFLGGASGLGAGPDQVLQGNQPGLHLGLDAAAGDVNCDGWPDLLLSQWPYEWWLPDPAPSDGPVRVYASGPGGWPVLPTWELGPDATVPPIQSNMFALLAAPQGFFGGCQSSAFVGAPGDARGGSPDVLGSLPLGAVFGYPGSTATFAAYPWWTASAAGSEQAVGGSVAIAGDLDGDGFADLAVGEPGVGDGTGTVRLWSGALLPGAAQETWTLDAPAFGGAFGAAVARAGDVNGDGLADLLVGAPDASADCEAGGAAYLFLGTASGPEAQPSWSAWGDQPGARLGATVDGAGDVDGDGYADLVVGAPGWSGTAAGEGVVWQFSGGYWGPGTVPAWTVACGMPDCQLGAALAGVGDVNGDGYSDIAVGAPGSSALAAAGGSASVFLGGVSGLAPASAWSFSGDQAGARVGAGLGRAGDIDGDGYTDIAVGAPSWDGPAPDSGKAWVFPGGPAGPSPEAAWTVDGASAGSMLGTAVTSAGDSNGDGYGDLAVGSPGSDGDTGLVDVFLGGAAGLASDPAVEMPSPFEAGGAFGVALGGGGDVGSEAFGDLVVGAVPVESAPEDSGGAALYLGNSGDGTPPAFAFEAQALQVNSGEPIAAGGRADGTGFRVGVKARSWRGRSRVRVQVEVKPHGVPFDGTGVVEEGAYMDSGLAGVWLEQAVPGLELDTPYHWRARVHVDPAHAPAARWGPWLYGGVSGDAAGVHVRTSGPDGDGDGEPDRTDCDPEDASVFPGSPETPYDGIDQDCDGGDLVDVDLDGYAAVEAGGGDCDDGDPEVHPLASESCNGVDDDCDGEVDDGACGDDDSATDDDSAEDDDGAAGDDDAGPGDDDSASVDCGCAARGCFGGTAPVAGLLLPALLRRRRG